MSKLHSSNFREKYNYGNVVQLHVIILRHKNKLKWIVVHFLVKKLYNWFASILIVIFYVT